MLASRDVNKKFSAKYICLALSLGMILAPAAISGAPAEKTQKPVEKVSAEKGASAAAVALPEKTADSEQAKEPDSTIAANTPAKESSSSAKAEDEGPKSGTVFETAEDIRQETPEQLSNRAIQHWNLGRVYMGQWDLDLAQTELDLAILSWPQMQVAHRDQCIVSLLRLNIPRSVAEFMMTVGLGEPIPMSDEEANNLIENGMVQHYKKGLVYARQQKWKEAALELEWAANLAPEDFAIQRSLAFAYANMGDFKRAENHYKKTFELAPHDGSARADLAYFLAETGKTSEAEKAMEEAVKTQPKAAAYHVDLSWMAEKRGDLDTASRELKTAVTLSPKHANLWAHLGRVLEQKGEKNEAAEAFRQAVSLDPNLSDAKEGLTRLKPTHS